MSSRETAMTDLQQIESRLLELTSTFGLRPTLDRAADIGDLLIEARSMVRHGEWAGWLTRLGVHRRTAWDHMAVANTRNPATAHPLFWGAFVLVGSG